MMCRFLYDSKCNITNEPCWFLVSGVEQITCMNYEKEEIPDYENPDKERE